METWMNLTNELMKDEIVQLELLCQQVIESLPLILVFGIPILFGTALLLTALDGTFAEDRDLRQSNKVSRTGELHPGLPAEKLSKPATRLLQSETNAAA